MKNKINYSQKHLECLMELQNSDKTKKILKSQVGKIDFELSEKLYNDLILNKKSIEKIDFQKVEPVVAKSFMDTEKLAYSTGVEEMYNGRLAVLILAGGQGSRLNHKGPKGTFNLYVDDENFGTKSIFQIHIENLTKAWQIYNNPIKLYIMTSEINHEETIKHFVDNLYFGYPEDSITFIKQKMMPTIDDSGKIIVESHNKISFSPDGNGGFASLLEEKGELQKLKEVGIDWLFVCNVDNVLARYNDPLFLGQARLDGVEVATKVLDKNSADEKIGVLLKYDGKIKVVEYSEFPQEQLYQKNKNGELKYKIGNIANYLFDISYMRKASKLINDYHVAHKKIEYLEDYNLLCNLDEESFLNLKVIEPSIENGYKFEKFIFDLFLHTDKLLAFHISRKRNFAPIKNEFGVDSPETARELYEAQYYYNEAIHYLNIAMKDSINPKEKDNLILKSKSFFDIHLSKFPDMKMDIYYYLSMIEYHFKNYLMCRHYSLKFLKNVGMKHLKADLLKKMPVVEDYSSFENAKLEIIKENYNIALEYLESIDENRKLSFEIQYALGFCKRKIGLYNVAREHIEKAKELNPISAEVYAELCALSIHIHDFKNAKLYLTEGLKLNSNSLHLTEIMVEYYRNLGKFEDMKACELKLQELRQEELSDAND